MKWPKDWTRRLPDAIMRKVRLRKGRQLESVFCIFYWPLNGVFLAGLEGESQMDSSA